MLSIFLQLFYERLSYSIIYLLVYYLLLQGTFCKLALGDDLNIVAQGTVFMDNEPNATVHGIPLASTDVRVSIDVAFQKNAILPRPVRDELILVSHAIGSIVAWPKKFVITSNNEVNYFIMPYIQISRLLFCV